MKKPKHQDHKIDINHLVDGSCGQYTTYKSKIFNQHASARAKLVFLNLKVSLLLVLFIYSYSLFVPKVRTSYIQGKGSINHKQK